MIKTVVVDLLFNVLSIVCGGSVFVFVFGMHYFESFLVLHSSCRGRALPLLSYGCLVTVNVPWLFLGVPWVGLQCLIMVFLIILTYFLNNRPTNKR